MILSPELSALVLAAIQSILLGNNGYALIGKNPAVAAAVELAGFIVIKVGDEYKGFSKASQAALAVAPYGVSNYKPVNPMCGQPVPDIEGAILARQERMMEF